MFAPHHNLTGALPERLPVITAVNGLNVKATGQKEQLELAREEDVHIESGQIALILAGLKKFLVGPDDMLQLLDLIIFATAVEQHRKLALCLDLILQVDIRGPVECTAEVINIWQKDINHETPAGSKVIVGIFERTKLLLDLIEVRNRVKGQENQIKLALMRQLIIAHIARVERHALLDALCLASQLTSIRFQDFHRDIQPLQLKVAGAAQQLQANPPAATRQFQHPLWQITHYQLFPERHILF